MTRPASLQRLLAVGVLTALLTALLATALTVVEAPRTRRTSSTSSATVDLSPALPPAGASRPGLAGQSPWHGIVDRPGRAALPMQDRPTSRSAGDHDPRPTTGRQFDPWIPERAPPRDT